MELEIHDLNFKATGYFVPGQFVMNLCGGALAFYLLLKLCSCLPERSIWDHKVISVILKNQWHYTAGIVAGHAKVDARRVRSSC